MATSNLSELTNNLREINSPVTVNVIAEPEKEVINTIKKGDSDIIKSLMAISQILMEQLSFDKDVENRRKLEEHLKPKDFQEQSLTTTATREDGAGGEGGGGGILETYGLMRLFGDGLKGLFGLFKRLGGFLTEILGLNTLFTALKDGLGSIIGKVLELGRVFGPLALRFTALAGLIYATLKGLEKFGSWFRDLVGLPSIANDPFNMRNYTGENPRYDRPMTPEEFEQNRIPKTVGGESARKLTTRPDGKPMSAEEFDSKRISKGGSADQGLGKNQLELRQHLIAGLDRAGISDPKERAAFLAQAHHESDSYKTLKEYGGGKASNIKGGNQYYGRGFLQITHKENYEKIGKMIGKDIVKNPDLLLDPDIAADASIAYWKSRVSPKVKDFGDVRQVTRGINPGEVDNPKYMKNWRRRQETFQRYMGNAEKFKPGTINKETTNSATKTEGMPLVRGEGLENGKGDPNWAAGMRPLAAEKIQKVLDILESKGYKSTVLEGRRSEERQAQLYAQGRTTPGNIVTHKKHSEHQEGTAADIARLDEKGNVIPTPDKISTKEQKAYYKALGEAAHSVGLRYGGTDFGKFIDAPHVELKKGDKQIAGDLPDLKKLEIQLAKKSDQTKNQSYAKMEKQLPEGGKYKEEESEMEETEEPILSEKISEPKSKLVKGELDLDKQVDSGYKGFFEDMVEHLEKMVSFTENIKETNKQMADAETAKKESDSSKQTASKKDEEAQKTMDDLFYEGEEKPTAKQQKEAEKTMDDLFGPEEPKITQIPNQNNPFGGGVFGNTPGTFGQNPFGTIQGVLGTIGSTVSMGQQIGNMGKYGMGGGMGGIYGAQGAIGGIQGVLGQMGQQSPALGGLGQVLGSVGSVAGSIEGIKNMGKYGMGGGGILGGISAASGVVGAAGNIYNAMGGLGQVLGGIGGNSTPEKGGKGFFEGIGDSIGNLFGGNEEKPSISSLDIGDDSASLSKSLMNDGMMLESTTQSVQAGKEEMMTPTSSEPTIVNAGGGSGGGGSGGGGNSQSNPSSDGVMGINIGVRNEEATLLRAQFGSVRIV